METVMTPEEQREARRQATDAKITAWMEEPRNQEFVESLNDSTKDDLIRKVCYREMKSQESNKLLSYAANHPKVRDWVAAKMAVKVAEAQALGQDLKGMKYVNAEFGLLRYSFDKAQEFKTGKAESADAEAQPEQSETKEHKEQNSAQETVNRVKERAMRNAASASPQSQEQKQTPVAKR